MTDLHHHLTTAAHALDNAAEALRTKLDRRIFQDIPEGRFTAIIATAQHLGQIRQLATAAHSLADALADPEPPHPAVSQDRPHDVDRLSLDHAA